MEKVVENQVKEILLTHYDEIRIELAEILELGKIEFTIDFYSDHFTCGFGG